MKTCVCDQSHNYKFKNSGPLEVLIKKTKNHQFLSIIVKNRVQFSDGNDTHVMELAFTRKDMGLSEVNDTCDIESSSMDDFPEDLFTGN